MDAHEYLEALARRARAMEAPMPEGGAARFVESVWRKIETREIPPPEETAPLYFMLGAAAVAASVMLLLSMAGWSEPAAAPSPFLDLFAV